MIPPEERPEEETSAIPVNVFRLVVIPQYIVSFTWEGEIGNSTETANIIVIFLAP